MRVFICWLITILTDWVGLFVFYYLIFCNDHYHEVLGKSHAVGNYSIEFSAVAAIVPAFICAIYAAINYELILSWAVIRWMSPLNVFSGRISHFFKTFVMSGAAWAGILSVFLRERLPNSLNEWVVPFIKGISESLYTLLFT